MPDISFPSSPSGGDTYTYNNITFTYDGEKWTAKAPVTTTSTYGDANVAAYSSAQGFIDLTDISVTSNSPSGNGSLSYNNVSGVFTFTPADASGSGGGSYGNTEVQSYLDAQGYSNVDLDAQTLTLNSTAGQLAISGGNNVDLRQTQFLYSATSDLPNASTYHGAIGHVHAEGALYFAHSGSWVKLANHGTDVQPASISTDSTDGTALALEGGDATGLNSTGGNVNIDSGTGALQSGYVNIGQSSQGVYIGANSSTAINVTGPLTVNNQLIIEDGVSEKFSSLSGATGVVTHDCDNGHIFYHSSISADFTANFTNLGLSTNYGTTLTLILDQGATARIPSAVQISGSAQTINWQGGSAPTGTNNGIDAVSFTILRVSGSYVVLGQLVDFT